MTPAPQMTRTQEQRSYRNAVQASLEAFYGRSKAEAACLVDHWWKRLKKAGGTRSGLFLHSEPLNTAAGIADMHEVVMTPKNRETYHRILDESRDATKTSASHVIGTPTSTDSERRKHIIHVVAKPKSNTVGRQAARTLAKKNSQKKAEQKRQTAFS